MNPKPTIDGVPRELLERIAESGGHVPRRAELRALLDAPALCATHTGDSCKYCGGSGSAAAQARVSRADLAANCAHSWPDADTTHCAMCGTPRPADVQPQGEQPAPAVVIDDDWRMNPCKLGHRDVGAAGGVAHCYTCDEKITAATTQEAFEQWNATHPAAPEPAKSR